VADPKSETKSGKKPDDKVVAIKPNKSILVAEDSIPNQKILQHLIIKLGFDVVTATDGVEAWTKLTANTEKNFVCIISDMMMPFENGLSLLKRVRGNDKLKSLPFVFVTAVADKELVKEALTYNVSGYILKPVTLYKVQTKLKELFPNHEFPKIAA
jgi:two-component system, chemotaxis family, chemotaxis protein CheY